MAQRTADRKVQNNLPAGVKQTADKSIVSLVGVLVASVTLSLESGGNISTAEGLVGVGLAVVTAVVTWYVDNYVTA